MTFAGISSPPRQWGHGFLVYPPSHEPSQNTHQPLQSPMDIISMAKLIQNHDFCGHFLSAEATGTYISVRQQWHGFLIHRALKRLTDVVAWLKALWIHFDHEYYIRETLKWLADVFAMFKAWWIRFDHRYYIHGTLKRLMGVLAWLMAWWIRTGNPCHCCLAGEEMSAKVVILAQFDHEYYIRGTLKWLADVFARLKAWWIRFSVKQVTDQKSMSLLPQQRGNGHKSHDFGSV
ncbi:hypothetical protein C8R44DRAFT_725410 [Mycena epipterygia]|nr:hypothetical protein C8R44DRAFT_725410 [Mycena epipterygia]